MGDKDLRIYDRENHVVTQGAFNAFLSQLDSAREDAELNAEDADRLRAELGDVYARLLRGEVIRAPRVLSPPIETGEQAARDLIDTWRDEWHMEPEPDMDNGNSKIYESLVSYVAAAIRAAKQQ